LRGRRDFQRHADVESGDPLLLADIYGKVVPTAMVNLMLPLLRWQTEACFYTYGPFSH
jgi:hypothetical protein